MPKISIEQIVVVEQLYPRNGVSDFNVNRLVAALQAGTKLPPIKVEAGTFRLVDGRHRLLACKECDMEKIEAVEAVYASDADFFADAVRCNVGHGEPLDNYAIKTAIIRLEQYGYTRDKVVEIVRLPPARIEKIVKGFAMDANSGAPVALKGGLAHKAGQPLDIDQQNLNRHYSGGKATFYVRQLCQMLELAMWPDKSSAFAAEMDRLVDLWTKIVEAAKAA